MCSKHTEVVSGLNVNWKGGDFETPHHYRVSSVVSLKVKEKEPLFGRMMYFYDPTFEGTTTKFVVINVFDSRFTTFEHRSWWVNTSHASLTVVPASTAWFSKPHVTTFCRTKANSLFILDFQESSM